MMIMKQLLFILFLVALGMVACEKPTVGYLIVKNAEFSPDTLEVRTVLDPTKDATREKNEAPWVSGVINGVLGTEPMNFELVGVSQLEGDEAAAKVFAEELVVYGNGRMEVPFKPASPKGHYVISLKVSNEGYSALLPEIYTVIIK